MRQYLVLVIALFGAGMYNTFIFPQNPFLSFREKVLEPENELKKKNNVCFVRNSIGIKKNRTIVQEVECLTRVLNARKKTKAIITWIGLVQESRAKCLVRSGKIDFHSGIRKLNRQSNRNYCSAEKASEMVWPSRHRCQQRRFHNNNLHGIY